MGLQIEVTEYQVKMFCCHRAVTRGTGLAERSKIPEPKLKWTQYPAVDGAWGTFYACLWQGNKVDFRGDGETPKEIKGSTQACWVQRMGMIWPWILDGHALKSPSTSRIGTEPPWSIRQNWQRKWKLEIQEHGLLHPCSNTSIIPEQPRVY